MRKYLTALSIAFAISSLNAQESSEKYQETVLLIYDVIHETGESVKKRPFHVRFGLEID